MTDFLNKIWRYAAYCNVIMIKGIFTPSVAESCLIIPTFFSKIWHQAAFFGILFKGSLKVASFRSNIRLISRRTVKLSQVYFVLQRKLILNFPPYNLELIEIIRVGYNFKERSLKLLKKVNPIWFQYQKMRKMWFFLIVHNIYGSHGIIGITFWLCFSLFDVQKSEKSISISRIATILHYFFSSFVRKRNPMSTLFTKISST